MFGKSRHRKLLGGETAAMLESALGGDNAAVIESALGHGGLGVQSESDRKLLSDGLEGEGVITRQRILGGKGRNAIMGFYVAVEGHIRFDDGAEAQFSSTGLDTSKLGDLDVGTIVPVRYDGGHQRVVLDTSKLEAAKQAHREAAADLRERRNAESIAASDAELAERRKTGFEDASAG